VIFSLDDVQPIYQIIETSGVDDAHVKKAAAELDALAAKAGT
jgi:hypothetical protein